MTKANFNKTSISSRKVHKAFSKCNDGRWSVIEHRGFLFGLMVYGNKWNKLKKFVNTRTKKQIMSHSQKFFIKLQKLNFTNIDIYSPQRIYSYSSFLNEGEAIKLIDNLTKVYFKIYETRFPLILNDNLTSRFLQECKIHHQFSDTQNSNQGLKLTEAEIICNKSKAKKAFLKRLFELNQNNYDLKIVLGINNQNGNNMPDALVFYDFPVPVNNFTINNQLNNSIGYQENGNINLNTFNTSNFGNKSYDVDELNNTIIKMDFLKKFLNFCNKGIFSNENNENINKNTTNSDVNICKIHNKELFSKYNPNEVKNDNSQNTDYSQFSKQKINNIKILSNHQNSDFFKTKNQQFRNCQKYPRRLSNNINDSNMSTDLEIILQDLVHEKTFDKAHTNVQISNVNRQLEIDLENEKKFFDFSYHQDLYERKDLYVNDETLSDDSHHEKIIDNIYFIC